MKISALDEQGKPVDWWFMYKVPQLSKGSSGGDAATGYEYVYYDSKIDASADPKLRRVARSPFVINEGKGALNLTLDLVFKNFKKPAKTTGWIIYNDEMPASTKERDNGNLGHTKGVIAFDTATKTAYWLLHSWPKFADPGAEDDPTPKYGQTYLCISIDLATAEKIADQMAQHQEPQTYFCNTADLAKTSPLYTLAQPLTAKPPADSDVIELRSAGKMPFKVIAKNREWDDDFWNDLVGPTLKDDMDVETWIRGTIPPIMDNDGIHKTFDIKYVTMGPLGIHWAWPETHDHAKWGITKHTDWICVGDINRMISQRKRGGGTIAFQNQVLWRSLAKTNLILAPPGHTRTEAHHIIEATHVEHGTPPALKAPAKTAAAKARSKTSPVKPRRKSGK